MAGVGIALWVGRTQPIVVDLAEVGRGDLATLWRAPDAMPDRGEITDTAAGTAWLDAQLASRAAGGAGPERRAATPAQRQASIHRFQLAQGVVPDGRGGWVPLGAAGINAIIAPWFAKKRPMALANPAVTWLVYRDGKLQSQTNRGVCPSAKAAVVAVAMG